MAPNSSGWLEFHVSRKARDQYHFDDALFAFNGNVIFANFHAARVFAQQMNQKRDLLNFPEQVVRASQINALGLIDELLHVIFRMYRERYYPHMLRDMLSHCEELLGPDVVDTTLRAFADQFPPLAVYRRTQNLESYLSGQSGGVSNCELLLEELLMLWLSNTNPAFAPFLELFDDTMLEKETLYLQMIDGVREFCAAHLIREGEGESIFDLLRAPALASPHSLEGQLEYIRYRWGGALGHYLYRLLTSLDLITEEDRPLFLGPGPILVPIYDFAGIDQEPERFSLDRDWMPRLVMLAKNASVWLDQLSKKYRRSITRLDQIPDEELDTLARWGFTGLWLIGVWERSKASQRIKQLCGNLDAVASAYSLFDYQIADSLGGAAACQQLRERAWQRGIRLASDMVPNHVGIDSRWVIEHPDWFISLDQSPFPSYSFGGPDLSWDERVGIFLEDHYYSRSDAAVVFKRTDRWTGNERYVYHGNDGTSMPWNDTAQLNYLNPEVREAVIQTILHVARQFPIIRFDAAMTLAKRHYQRLWFPEPGTGGAIPSRAEHGLTKEQFDAAMPQEFWREVVERVAQEVPDTLLLAEAFWLMESYFVRTLGMHRVYNSAFMHMLRDEENAKYRALMKNTLEFDPEILKRYVNFMNNPDERTAVDQFGKDDKYFGVCTVMVTMPGLPMFGHGQVEGYAEKYGMEYQRAYWEEMPDLHLIARHEREIAPLLHRRYLFSGVEHFLLYDFFTPEGFVNENVYAYSNRVGDERALVLYHNAYASVRGWIRTSVAYSVKQEHAEERRLLQRSLGEGLDLHSDEKLFCLFRDHVTGLEYIRSSKEICEKGLYVELDAYKYHVFLDFRIVRDNDWHQYAHLCSYLDGRGVPSIDMAVKEIFLQPIHYPFKEVVNAAMFRRLLDARLKESDDLLDSVLLDELEQKLLRLLSEMKQFIGGAGEPDEIVRETRTRLEGLLRLPILVGQIAPSTPNIARAIERVQRDFVDELTPWATLLGWLFVHNLGRVQSERWFEQQSRSWMDEWMLGRILASTLRDLGLDDNAAERAVLTIKPLISHQRWFEIQQQPVAYKVIEELFQDSEVQQLLGVNRHQGILWFHKEAFERLLWWILLLAVVQLYSEMEQRPDEVDAMLDMCVQIIEHLHWAAEQAGYQVEKLLGVIPVHSAPLNP